MKTQILFLFLFAAVLNTNAQVIENAEMAEVHLIDESHHDIFEAIERQEVQFPQGKKALINYIYKNLNYPELAQEYNIEGTVVVKFTVQATGEIDHIKIVKGLGLGCDEAVVDLVREMPDWIPSIQDFKKAASTVILPVKFRLQ